MLVVLTYIALLSLKVTLRVFVSLNRVTRLRSRALISLVMSPTSPLNPPFTAWKPYPIPPINTLLFLINSSLPMPILLRTNRPIVLTSLWWRLLLVGTETYRKGRCMTTPLPPCNERITEATRRVSLTWHLKVPLIPFLLYIGNEVRRMSLVLVPLSVVARLPHRWLVQQGVTGVTNPVIALR